MIKTNITYNSLFHGLCDFSSKNIIPERNTIKGKDIIKSLYGSSLIVKLLIIKSNAKATPKVHISPTDQPVKTNNLYNQRRLGKSA